MTLRSLQKVAQSKLISRRKFATAIAAGKTQAEALRVAGSKVRSVHGASSIASKLLAEPEVAAMVAAKTASLSELVEEGLLAGVRETMRIASRQAPNVTNKDVVSATYLLAKMSGEIIDRAESTTTHVVEFRGFNLVPLAELASGDPKSPVVASQLPQGTQVVEVGPTPAETLPLKSAPDDQA